ncbi:MAG: glycerophosphodiester phosphodiesterase [Rhodospirillales bacterium]|nr:glycerophosphodiester phosphodiesterase [Rhodospirillales bacterium]
MKTPRIIGHRGACGHAPENTLASIRKAAELGAEWVEFDTMLSADNRVAIFHDETLKRTTGTHGNVAETNWDSLQSLDAGSWFDDAFRGENIPLLSEVIQLLEELEMGAVVEIKPSRGHDIQTAHLCANIVKDTWPRSLPTPILSSFSEQALMTAREQAPDIPRALNMWRSLDGWQERLQQLDCEALHCQHDLLDEAQSTAILAVGYDLRCFTVNEPARAHELFNWGVSSIFTDFPDRFSE